MVVQWCAGKPKFGGGDIVEGKVPLQYRIRTVFVYLFNVGGLGSRGARPRPNRAQRTVVSVAHPAVVEHNKYCHVII